MLIKQICCFSDEILPSFNKNWIYLATVAVEKEYLERVENCLLNARFCAGEHELGNTDADWKDVEEDKYYSKNNSTVKFNELNSADKFFIAKRWLKLIENTNFLGKTLKIKISGLNLNKLEKENFGNKSGRETLMYSYFMERHLKSICSYFFNKNSDHKVNFWHDRGKQEKNVENRLKSLKKLEMEKVKFIDDNHRNFSKKSEEFTAANMIQLADILAGTAMNSFSNENKGEKRNKLLDIGVELIKEGLDTNYNRSDRKISVSFFPDKEWKGEDNLYEFHQDREIRRTKSDQRTLKNF